MSQGEIAVVHIDGEGPISPDLMGAHVAILVQLVYTGSRVSDIIIGGHKVVQIPNELLRFAAKEHDDICDTEGG